jgi:hypothetical protein
MELITLQEYLDYAVINETKAETLALLTQSCNSAENIVKRFLKYNPLSTEYTEKFSPSVATNSIKTDVKPIIEISSVKVDGIELDELLFFSVDEYIFSSLGDKVFTSGFNNVEITFTAGYDFEEIPEDIKVSVLQIADIFNQERVSHLAQSISTPDGGLRNYVSITKYGDILKRIEGYRIQNLFF